MIVQGYIMRKNEKSKLPNVYVYDIETGLYYLRSRYYNSVWSKFLNADSIFCGNLFTYCNNYPTSQKDPNGLSGINDYEEDVSFFDGYSVSSVNIDESSSTTSIIAGLNPADLVDRMYYEFMLTTDYIFRDNNGDRIGYFSHDDEKSHFVGMYDKENRRFSTVLGMKEGYFHIDDGMIILNESSEEFFTYGFYDLQISCKQSLYVRYLQLRLGFSPEEADGYYGPKTQQKVKERQNNYGIGEDGIVGPITKWFLINEQGG